MAGTWTKAGQIRRSFKAGRPLQKDRDLTPTAAIFETCTLLDKLRTAMQDAGLEPDDVRAILVVEGQQAGHKFVHNLLVPPPKQLPRLFSEAEKIKKPVMWGIIFNQLDREMAVKDPSRATATWVYPFRVSDPAQRVFAAAIESLQKRAAKTEFS